MNVEWKREVGKYLKYILEMIWKWNIFVKEYVRNEQLLIC